MTAVVPAGRVFGLDAQTLISISIHLFNLVVLAFIMSKFLYKPVRTFLSDRTMRIAGQMQRARDEMTQAENLRREYEDKIKNIEQERDELYAQALKKADEEREQLLAQAAEDAEAIKAEAKAEAETIRNEARDSMKKFVFDASAAMAQNIITHTLDEKEQEALFAQTLSDLEESSWWD